MCTGSAGKSAQNVFFSHTFKNKDFNLNYFLLNYKSFTEKKCSFDESAGLDS